MFRKGISIGAALTLLGGMMAPLSASADEIYIEENTLLENVEVPVFEEVIEKDIVVDNDVVATEEMVTEPFEVPVEIPPVEEEETPVEAIEPALDDMVPDFEDRQATTHAALISIKNGWWAVDANGVKVTAGYTTKYTGNYLNPIAAITNGSAKIYRPAYSPYFFKNKNVGKATVMIRGNHARGYRDSFWTNFNIAKTNSSTPAPTPTPVPNPTPNPTPTPAPSAGVTSVASATIASISDQNYNGNEIQPKPSVKVGTKTLVRDRDYKLTYTNNVNAGTGQVVVTGIGNYSGTKTANFTIKPISISSASSESIAKQQWTGSALKPTPTLKRSNKTLKSGTDYTVAYSNNTNVGTGTITVTGKGNYTGTKKISFVIERKGFDSAVISAIPKQTYTGSAIKPKVTVKIGNATLKEGADYTVNYSSNTNVGTAKVRVTGKGNYNGSKEATFQIVAASFSSATITIPTQKYTGNALTPVPTVKVGTATLRKDTDYTITYKNNKAVGKATATLTGKGKYSGTKTVTFQIAKSLKDVTIAAIADKTYTGSAFSPAPTVKDGTKTLTKGTDYTVAYKNNVDAGTATVTITGKGNYMDSKSSTFKINKASIAQANVAAVANKAYTGSAITPAPAVKLGSKALTNTVDYTLSYRSNVNPGVATITVNGKGNYTGSRSIDFKIVKASISKATIDKIADKVYTGKAITPGVTVRLDGRIMTKDKDYTVAYKNNTKVGTATVTVTGKGNYSGSVSTTFRIGNNIAKTTVSAVANQKYTGKAIVPKPAVKDGATTLKNGTHYTLTYKNNTNVGTATITITGKGTYVGTKNVTFKIVK